MSQHHLSESDDTGTQPANLPAQAADLQQLARRTRGGPPTGDDLDFVLAGIGPRRRAFNQALVHAADRATDWLRRHWLAVINVGLATYIGVAVLAPVGYALGFTGASSTVFHAYRLVCDQIPSHSFFLFGYQICLCQRCLAIYSSMLVAGLALSVLRNQRALRSIGWWAWFLTMLPMALDGGTQFFGWRESNVWLRLLTGIIFGLGTAWFTLPYLDASARAELAEAPHAPSPR
jgi:uncharacterized membrane protein